MRAYEKNETEKEAHAFADCIEVICVHVSIYSGGDAHCQTLWHNAIAFLSHL